MLKRRDDPFMLVIGMTGVKMGDRFVQVGWPDGPRLAAIASKVGLSGRAVAIVPDEESAARARKGAEQAGVLVEIEIAPPTHLPLEAVTVDLVIVDNTGGLLTAMTDNDRSACVREAKRITRPGGRVMVLGAGPPSGLAALLSRGPSAPPLDSTPLLAAAGF